MQDRKLDLDQYEDNLLHSCWRVGACHSRTGVLSSFNRNEIAKVDIVACCKQITSMIGKQASQLQRSLSVAPRQQLNYHFKDFAQLTCGVTNIYCHQVDLLLEDTKHLLDQMKGNTFDLVLTTKKSVTRTNRKRKRVITKESKLTISKRFRFDESDLFNESVQEHFTNMLSECQEWQPESPQQVELEKSIELPRNYTQSRSYHSITITEEFEIHENPSDIYASDGFGDCDHPDLSFFQELYPRISAKRRLTFDCISTDILPAKMPRLDDKLNTSQADIAISTTKYPETNSIDLDTENITYIVCEPSLPLDLLEPPPRKISTADNNILAVETAQPTTVKNTAKNSRRKKLIIDKCIEFSQEKLKEQHRRYLNNLKETVVVIPTPSQRLKAPDDLLIKLNKRISLFPDIIRNYPINLTKEEMEVISELTLISIFGVEFTEDLVEKIFVPIKSRKIQEKNIVHTPLEDLILTPPSLPVQLEGNNNNNISKYTISYEDNHFGEIKMIDNDYFKQILCVFPSDAYSVMMDLLMIWRNNPEIQGIDAIKFIHSFPDRIKAALAFNFLLYLARDNFIKISKKPNSIEMDEIELGPESNKLIESLSHKIS
ncbi:hypothetical protein KR054_010772 [Drosophila jambulina]|nr:hypothetical protein KR054_010772 [Drosophila jambulina]